MENDACSHQNMPYLEYDLTNLSIEHLNSFKFTYTSLKNISLVVTILQVTGLTIVTGTSHVFNNNVRTSVYLEDYILAAVGSKQSEF